MRQLVLVYSQRGGQPINHRQLQEAGQRYAHAQHTLQVNEMPPACSECIQWKGLLADATARTPLIHSDESCRGPFHSTCLGTRVFRTTLRAHVRRITERRCG